MKKTGWYPANINPVHIGRYEVRYGEECPIRSRHWNGRKWEHMTGGLCIFGNNSTYIMPGEAWRGITNEPKGN